MDAELRPRPVQTPRPRIFVAGTHPYRPPIARALRWDGFFPISYRALLSPDQISEYLSGAERPEGWDLYLSLNLDYGVDEYEDAGVTWLVEGVNPEGDWVNELRHRIRSGPPR